jgi:hypothetical protein
MALLGECSFLLCATRRFRQVQITMAKPMSAAAPTYATKKYKIVYKGSDFGGSKGLSGVVAFVAASIIAPSVFCGGTVAFPPASHAPV